MEKRFLSREHAGFDIRLSTLYTEEITNAAVNGATSTPPENLAWRQMADVTSTSASNTRQPGHTIHNNITKDNARTHCGDVYGGVVHNNYAADTEGKEQEIFAELIRWLNAPDPTNDHYEAQRRYEKGTGSWFLDSEDFRKWLDGGESLLWLYGPPGCCKTILCSAAIERTKQETSDAALAYFYFTFRDTRKQTYGDFLRTIIAQLLEKGNVPEELITARDHNRTHHSTLELIAVQVIQPNSQVYLLVDGLDECPDIDENRNTIMKGFDSLAKQCPKLRLLVASRPESDIEYFMNNELESRFFGIEAAPVDEDIRLYVGRELGRDRRLRSLSKEMKEYISIDLAKKAGGMFRWADLQLDSLKRLKVLRPRYIKETLSTLPRTLDETYDRILLQYGNSKEVLTVLRWVALHSDDSGYLYLTEIREACITNLEREPFIDTDSREAVERLIWDMSSLLRFEEIVRVKSDDESESEYIFQEGSVIFPGEAEVDTGNDSEEYLAEDHEKGPQQDSEIVVEVLDGLLEDSECEVTQSEDDESEVTQSEEPTTESDGTRRSKRIKVSFAHLSVMEYLTSNHIKKGPAADFHLDQALGTFSMAQTCIAYLLHVKSDWESRDERARNHVEDREGSKYVKSNARLVPTTLISDLMGEYSLLSHAASHWDEYQAYAESQISAEDYAGLKPLVSCLLESGRDFLRDLGFCIALQDDVTSLLGLSASHDEFPIVTAAAWRLEKTLASLIEANTSVGRTAHEIGLALIIASWMGVEKVVEYLLDNGAVEDSPKHWTRDQFERLTDDLTELSTIAIDRDRDKIWLVSRHRPQDPILNDVSSLIRTYSFLDPKENCLVNAFRVAVREGQSRVVSALCKAGVHPSTSMGSSADVSALQYACESNSRNSTVRALLAAGADANSPKHGIRPLWIVVDSYNRSDGDQKKCIRLLLDAGADPNSGRDDGKNAETAFQIASQRGFDETVKMLLDAGARPDFIVEPHGREIAWKPMRSLWEMDRDEQRHYIAEYLNSADSSAARQETPEIDQSAEHIQSKLRSSLGIEPWKRFQRKIWNPKHMRSNSTTFTGEEEVVLSSDVD